MDHRKSPFPLPFPFPFQSPPPPAFLSDGSFLPPSERRPVTNDDVDRTLSNVFSTLNLSPPPHAAAAPPFFPAPTYHGDRFLHRRLPEQSLRRQCSYEFSPNFNHEIADYYKPYYEIALSRIQIQNQIQNHSKISQNYAAISTSSPLMNLRGKVYALAKHQTGCKLLQSMFEKPTIEEIEMVLFEIIDSISDLMKDQFGNYLVQKLIAVCNDNHKMKLINSLIKIPADIILVCMNPHGTRAVQKLLENLSDPIQVKLVMRALYRGAVTLANDPNGHHVIQYCLVHFHSDINKPILNEIANECYKIATDRSGCCVLQACVEHSRGEVRTRIVSEIIANSLHLAEDPFGNYVLQHMVEQKIPEFTALLVSQLQGNFAALACNKYASNVVEKCLTESVENVCTRIILEIVRSPNSSLLLVDPYANFVIQSALKVSKGFAHECLRCLISKNISSMRSNLYGKKILEKVDKKGGNFAYS